MNHSATKGNMLFRCDGTAQTGLGHVSRCLALAEASAELGCECRFAGHWNEAAREMISTARMKLDEIAAPTGSAADAVETAGLIQQTQMDTIVVDSYAVGENYLERLRDETAALVLIDDFARLKSYPCRAVINFTVNAGALPYPKPDAVYLLGPKFFLARRRLRDLRRRTGDFVPGNQKLCVAIGGVDRHDFSSRVLGALVPVADQLAVRVIVSQSHASLGHLEGLLRKFRAGSVLKTQLPDLADEFAWADLCVCGGGMTKYEAAYLGIPAVILSQTEEQAGETVDFARRGLAVDFGLGTRLGAASLSERILSWWRDSERHLACRRAGLLTFPADPTRNAAEAVRQLTGT